jgi:hypothetical protein
MDGRLCESSPADRAHQISPDEPPDMIASGGEQTSNRAGLSAEVDHEQDLTQAGTSTVSPIGRMIEDDEPASKVTTPSRTITIIIFPNDVSIAVAGASCHTSM